MIGLFAIHIRSEEGRRHYSEAVGRVQEGGGLTADAQNAILEALQNAPKTDAEDYPAGWIFLRSSRPVGAATDIISGVDIEIGELIEARLHSLGDIEVPEIDAINVQYLREIFNEYRNEREILAAEEREQREEEEEKEIDRIAKRILREGDPVQFIQDRFNENHIGDYGVFLGLLASVGAQLCLNSEGIQPGLSGQSGKGKSAACKAMFHLLPDGNKWTGSFSSRLFFYKRLEPGTVIFIDEAQNLDEFVVDMLKTCTSQFQTETVREIVDKKGEIARQFIPPRSVFWLTSVDSNFEDQLINRQLGLASDDTGEQDERVADAFLLRYQVGALPMPENRRVKICRRLFKILIEDGPKVVKIPFSDRILWKDKSNRRNLPIFLDCIIAFASIRRYQRETDEDARIIATKEDFDIALTLMKRNATQQLSKLNKDQQAVLDTVKGGHWERDRTTGIYSITRPKLQEVLRWHKTRLHRALKGRDGVGGIEDKVPGLYSQPESEDAGGGRIIRYERIYFSTKTENFLDQFAEPAVLLPGEW